MEFSAQINQTDDSQLPSVATEVVTTNMTENNGIDVDTINDDDSGALPTNSSTVEVSEERINSTNTTSNNEQESIPTKKLSLIHFDVKIDPEYFRRVEEIVSNLTKGSLSSSLSYRFSFLQNFCFDM